MVGYVRFLLAYLVLLSHIDVRLFGINPGVFAVVIFYILAGYVVTRLWHDILPQGPGLFARFLRDRALRILPMYVYICLLTLIFLTLTRYGRPDFAPSKLLYNALIVPLNYFMWLDSDILRNPAGCLVPPAWSLGAELQAYLAMTLVFLARPLKYLLAPASVAVYLMAGSGILNPDYFGYRLLPGVFFFFVAGHSLSSIRAGRADRFDRLNPPLAWLLIAVAGVFFWRQGVHRAPYVRETIAGLLVGIPMVYLLHAARLRLPGNGICGALSYGLFLSHFLVIRLLDYAGFHATHGDDANIAYVSAVTVGSLLIAWCGVYYIEAPIDRYRKNGSRRHPTPMINVKKNGKKD